jgi:DNA-binding CsgD family transcriptional regulator
MDLRHGTGLVVGTSKSRNRRGRRFIRDSATIEREHRALDMLVKGMRQAQIARELEMSSGGVSILIRRALEYRAQALLPTVEAARTLILERLERLLERWWPLATGDYVDPETGSSDNPPSPRAVDTVLKILEQMAKLTGAAGPTVRPEPAPPTFAGGIHVHTAQPGERDRLIADIVTGLNAAKAKTVVIEGHLADAKTSLSALAGGEHDDTPGPPPRREDAA